MQQRLMLLLWMIVFASCTDINRSSGGGTTKETWVAVSRHAMNEHRAASSFFADTVEEQHVLRHERIGRFHLYVLAGVHEEHAAHRYFAEHPATHLLVRNHAIEGTYLPPLHTAQQRPRARHSRYNPWQHTERTWLIEGAACRTNMAAEGRRGYSAGGFSWGIDVLDWGGSNDGSGQLFLDGALCTTATGNQSHIYILDTGVAAHDTFRFPVHQDYSWYAGASSSSTTASNSNNTSNSNNNSTNSGGDKTVQNDPIRMTTNTNPDPNLVIDPSTGLYRANGDCHGHGTHVAGLAASTVYGVATDAIVHAIQVLDCEGRGSFDALIAGLLYVQEYGERPAVINLSLGVLNAYVSSVAMLIEELTGPHHGVPVVASVGNNGVDACEFFPANVPQTVAVAASRESQQLAVFSNYGTCVDVTAPGNDIISTAPNNAAVLLSGTSMAAPIVSGMLALLQQRFPEHSRDVTWLVGRLKEEARPLLAAEGLGVTPNVFAQVHRQDSGGGPPDEWHLPPPYQTPPYVYSKAEEPESAVLLGMRALLVIIAVPLLSQLFMPA